MNKHIWVYLSDKTWKWMETTEWCDVDKW